MSTYTFVGTLRIVTCARAGCGVAFALTQEFAERRDEDHASFYCPNGHSQYYPQKTDLELVLVRRVEIVAYAHKACVDAEHVVGAVMPWDGWGKVVVTDTREVPVGWPCALCHRIIVEPTAASAI